MPKNIHRRPKRFVVSMSRLVALTFVLAFGAIGSFLLFTSHAANAPVKLEPAFNRGLCMDNYDSSTATKNKIDTWACNGTYAQEWTIQNVSGGFLLVDGQGTCADDTGGAVGTSSTNRVYLQTYVCNASDHAQIWKWSGAAPSELQNAYNSGCINVPGSSTTNGQQLIIYPCSPVTNNAQWYSVAVAAPVPTVKFAAPASGASVSGTVVISVQASIPSGTVASISISLPQSGTTLTSCPNATTCFYSLNSKSFSNGALALRTTAVGSGGGSAQANESVSVNNPVASPPPPTTGGGGSGGGSDGGGGGGSDSGGGSDGGSGDVSTGDGSDGGSGDLSFDDSGSSDGSLDISPDTSDGSTGSDIGVTQAPDDTLSNGSSSVTGPTVFDILADRITSSSITISWQAANANTYLIKYGTNKSALKSVTVKSTAAEPSLTLTKLQSKSQIYVAITPKQNNTSGATVSTTFNTLKSSNTVGAIITWTLFLLVAAVGILLLRRKLIMMRSDGAAAPMIDIEHAPVYPQEDTATQTDRLNWWMNENQRQAAAQQQAQPHHIAADDIPDMYDEGRKRLEDEQKNNQLPGA